MDHNAIVEEIIRRVAQKISEAEEGCAGSAACGGQPGLLVLTQDHGTNCHAVLESEALKARYRTDCALMHHYEVDLDDYEAVVLFDLSCAAMAALANGACDSAYTRLASKAILSGKTVYVPTEEVELYQYKETAPAAYYNMMQKNLDLLVASGVVLCSQASLEQVILGASPRAALRRRNCFMKVLLWSVDGWVAMKVMLTQIPPLVNKRGDREILHFCNSGLLTGPRRPPDAPASAGAGSFPVWPPPGWPAARR